MKNKLYEIKAWAKSLNAKKMQAAFIVLTYNLSQLLNREIEGNTPDDEPQDKANGKKKVYNTSENLTLNTANLSPGLYIYKVGNFENKFIVK